MLKQMIAVGGAVVLGALIAVAVMDRPATAQAAADGGARVQVVAGAGAFIMYETGGNQSWVAFPQANDKKFAWFPLKRLDDEQKVQVWRLGKNPE